DDRRMFRVIAPKAEWWSCYADSQTQNHVQFSSRNGGIKLDYPDLLAEDDKQTGISVSIEISPSPRADEVLFQMRVRNGGERTVSDVMFPQIGAWLEQGGAGKDCLAPGANKLTEPRMFPTSAGNIYARRHQRSHWIYPVHLYCPWVDLSGPDGGLSYINYMTEPRNGAFFAENLAGYGNDFRLLLGWAHFMALRPGETWVSPPMGLALHAADWHETADRYRTWFDAMVPPDYSRPVIRSRIGFQNVMFRGFDGTPIRRLDRIPEAAAAGRKYGVDFLCVWDKNSLGNYARSDPHDLMDYAPDEREMLRRGLCLAEREGTSTCALTNFRHPNIALHLSQPDIMDRIQKRFDGTLRTENWAASHNHSNLFISHMGPESNVFSPFSEAHQKRVFRITREYMDMGYTSMFYDQPFEFHPDYGYVDKGRRPETTHQAALNIVDSVRKELLALNADAVIIGEECDIFATPVIDQWMSWSISALSRAPEAAMIRYAIPHTLLSWVMDHEPERASMAFGMGMHLCLMVHGAEGTLEDEPEFAGHVGRLAALRKATADRTAMAVFRHHQGLEIDGDDGFHAYAFDSPAGPAVIASAPGAAASGRVRIQRESLASGGTRESGILFHLDGSTASHQGDGFEFSLEKDEVVVWTL
ncbi:MAG: hypothetical protein ABIH23_02675, partial [bacterium]